MRKVTNGVLVAILLTMIGNGVVWYELSRSNN